MVKEFILKFGLVLPGIFVTYYLYSVYVISYYLIYIVTYVSSTQFGNISGFKCIRPFWTQNQTRKTDKDFEF